MMIVELLPAARKLFLRLKHFWLPEIPYRARSWAIYIQAEVEVETKIELKFTEAQEDEPAFFDMFSMDLAFWNPLGLTLRSLVLWNGVAYS